MNPHRLLIMVLNLNGPIPNAAAINAHNPNSILFIRLPSRSLKEETKLKNNLKILKAWGGGNLPDYYEFDTDIQLELIPDSPTNNARIDIIDLDIIHNSEEFISSKIKDIYGTYSHFDIRIDVSVGKKEDAASLSRIQRVNDFQDISSTWYTDVQTGISIEIGTGQISERKPLDFVTRFWLNGFPILSANRRIDPSQICRKSLINLLDILEKTDSTRPKKPWGLTDSQFNMMQEFSNLSRIADNSDDVPKKNIQLPVGIFGEDGFWLEELTGLCLAESWNCKEIFVGVSLGSSKHRDRMGSLNVKISYSNPGNELPKQLIKLLQELDTLPAKLIDFEKNTTKRPELAQWIISGWKNLPKQIRQTLTLHCARRDLDIVAEMPTRTLFVECKLHPTAYQTTKAQDQLNSLIFAVDSRHLAITIIAHAHKLVDSDSKSKFMRSSEFDFIAPWFKLRKKDEIFKLPISNAR